MFRAASFEPETQVYFLSKSRCSGRKEPVKTIPRIFGGYARNRILYTLGVRGPQGRRELARAAEVDPQQTLEIVRIFARTGVLTHYPGELKPIELNQNFCAAQELRRLIYAIAGLPPCPTKSSQEPLSLEANVLELFGNRSRGLVLMELANGPSPKTTATIMAATKLTEQSVSAAVHYLERDAIVTSFVKRRARHIQLNPSFMAHFELQQFLVKLREATGSRDSS